MKKNFYGILLAFFVILGAVATNTNGFGVMADWVDDEAGAEYNMNDGTSQGQNQDNEGESGAEENETPSGSGYIGIMPFNTSWLAVQTAINNATGTAANPTPIDLTNPALPGNFNIQINVGHNTHIHLISNGREFTGQSFVMTGTNTVRMTNLRISTSGPHVVTGGTAGEGPFRLLPGVNSHTTVQLIGDNRMTNTTWTTLTPTPPELYRTGAGIHVPQGATITFTTVPGQGPGSMRAQGGGGMQGTTNGAGIGGHGMHLGAGNVPPYWANAGTVNVNSGTIIAIGPPGATLNNSVGQTPNAGRRATGIGGGTNHAGSSTYGGGGVGGNGGNLNVRGGRVYAVGGHDGTGIGGGQAGNNVTAAAGNGGHVRVYDGAYLFARGGNVGIGGIRTPITPGQEGLRMGSLWIQVGGEVVAIAEVAIDQVHRRAVRPDVTGGGMIVPAWLGIPSGMPVTGEFISVNINDPTDTITVPIGTGRNFAFTGFPGQQYRLMTNETPSRIAIQVGPAPASVVNPVVFHMPGTSSANREMRFAGVNPITAAPSPLIFASRHVGYGHGPATSAEVAAEVTTAQPADSNNTGIRRAIITNPAGNVNVINLNATITGANASAFEIVMSTGTNPGLPVRVGNTNPQTNGATQLIPGLPNATQGGQVWVRPVLGLPVGTYTANLVVSGTFLGLPAAMPETSVTIPLSFTVTPFSPVPLTWQSMQADGVTASTAGINSSTWAARHAGYGRVTSVGLAPVSAAQVLNVNADTGVKRFVITNPTGNMNITGATATLINHPSNPALPSGMTVPFQIQRVLQPGHGATSLAANGQINVGTPGNVAAGPGANIQVWPQLGLPPGTWQATLRVTGNFVGGVGATATLDIPLSFTVVGAELTLVKANPQWGTATAASALGNPLTTTANTANPTRTKDASPGDQVTITAGLLAQFLPPTTTNNHSSRFNITVSKNVGGTVTNLFPTGPLNTFPSGGVNFDMPAGDATVTVTIAPVGAALVLNLEAQNLHFGTHPITLNHRTISLQDGFVNGNSGLNPANVGFEVFNSALTDNWRVTVAAAPGGAGCSEFYRLLRVGTTNISLGPADAFNFTGAAAAPGNPAHLIQPFGWNDLNYEGVIIDVPPGRIARNVGTPRTAVVTWTLIVGP